MSMTLEENAIAVSPCTFIVGMQHMLLENGKKHTLFLTLVLNS